MNAQEKERHEEARWMAQPQTPKDLRTRASYGSLLISVQTIKGLCPFGKCARKTGHTGECWPKENNDV